MDYKFITYEEGENDFKSGYPNARSNEEKTEVVISCLSGDGTHSKRGAIAHINNNWTQSNEGI